MLLEAVVNTQLERLEARIERLEKERQAITISGSATDGYGLTQEFLVRLQTSAPVDHGAILRALVGAQPLDEHVASVEVAVVSEPQTIACRAPMPQVLRHQPGVYG